MKTRDGWVSNSSTTSFYFTGKTREQLDEMMEHLLKAEAVINGTPVSRADDVYEISDRDTPWDGSKQLTNGRLMLVSVGDNTLSWEVQEFLEVIADERRHWG